MSESNYALSFGQAVGDYERGRPGYPDEAVEWMLAAAQRARHPASAEPLTVADIGAGTGKFTASLVARGLDVIAVEPDPVMRETLSAKFPSVDARAGLAETLPLDDNSVDLVTFAQSWHWVTVPDASADVARVLRPAGLLALVWNIRDASIDWVDKLSGVMGVSGAEEFDTENPPVGDALEVVDHAEFHWVNPLTREQLEAMVTSRSYIIAMAADDRAEVLRDLDQLLATHPQLAGRTQYDLPYVTRVTLARPVTPSTSTKHPDQADEFPEDAATPRA